MVDAAALFEQFNQINVLIVGDVMIDRYLTGEVNRVSPEAPVPVVQFQRVEDRLGDRQRSAQHQSPWRYPLFVQCHRDRRRQ
ncbi:MAG: hypothetical protein IPH16_19790 [Haliscomenobacter sp.]|nr:hypothetical protein [Haliscomenobacter sp.]